MGSDEDSTRRRGNVLVDRRGRLAVGEAGRERGRSARCLAAAASHSPAVGQRLCVGVLALVVAGLAVGGLEAERLVGRLVVDAVGARQSECGPPVPNAAHSPGTLPALAERSAVTTGNLVQLAVVCSQGGGCTERSSQGGGSEGKRGGELHVGGWRGERAGLQCGGVGERQEGKRGRVASFYASLGLPCPPLDHAAHVAGKAGAMDPPECPSRF